MAYKVRKPIRSSIKSVEVTEGTTIEEKIERIVSNKEPIADGAPIIYTERKDGVIAAYNIRTDRFELAAEAMDAVSRSVAAKREAKAEMKIEKTEAKKEIGEAKSIQGNGSTESAASSE